MEKQFDAIVIGAGIIGAATAYKLACKNWKVLCVDKLPAAGYGSTSGSCAIIRPYYSTLEGSAIAYESHFYWNEWADYLGVEDERGLAHYNSCGNLIVKTEENSFLEPVLRLMDELDVPYQEMTGAEVVERLPKVVMNSFSPAKPVDHPDFALQLEKNWSVVCFFHVVAT